MEHRLAEVVGSAAVACEEVAGDTVVAHMLDLEDTGWAWVQVEAHYVSIWPLRQLRQRHWHLDLRTLESR